MTQVFRSLQEVESGYTIFEPDQLLTHTQLNRAVAYLDDQERLGRIALQGLGIVSGLRARRSGANVVLSPGVGVTSDGDLVAVATAVEYDRVKPYGENAPVYEPFQPGETPPRAFELVASGGEEETATPFESFIESDAGAAGWIAVLFVESYVQDHDLCTGPDCDNLGQECVHTPRLLLFDRESAAGLTAGVRTAHAAAAALPAVAAQRPLFPAGLNQWSDLAARFRAACAATSGRLEAALARLHPSCGTFLDDAFSADPSGAWLGRLNELRNKFADDTTGIQYYYDFLKDLCDTYEELRAVLLDDVAAGLPEPAAFPKHLLLGDIDGGDSQPHRTGFFPAAATPAAREWRQHARLLALKLDTQIRTFAIPNAAQIRITPSRFEDRPLEERAIPFYYRTGGERPIHTVWSRVHERRGESARIPSYNAASFGAQDPAGDPLAAPLARHPFFRVEGHLGKPAPVAMTAVQKQIAAANLPFTVRAVLASGNRAKITLKPLIRYGDLHRIHYLFRQDVADQLSEVGRFGAHMKEEVDEADARGGVFRDSEPTRSAKQLTATAVSLVQNQVALASTQLRKSYTAYRVDPSWKVSASTTVTNAAELKNILGESARTDFVTPVDSIIGNRQTVWVDWLDGIIGDKEAKEDDRLLVGNFLREHPGIEHLAGVLRGGTFVLVYDESNMVVADLALPYRWEDTSEPEAPEPPLTPGTLRPDEVLIRKPITLRPPVIPQDLDSVLDRAQQFLEPKWKAEITVQNQRLQSDLASQDSKVTNLYNAILTQRSPATRIDTGAIAGGGNLVLKSRATQIEAKANEVEELNRQVTKETDPAEKVRIQRDLDDAQKGLGELISSTLEQTVRTGRDVEEDVAIQHVIGAVDKGTGAIADPAVKNNIRLRAESLQGRAKPQLQSFLGTLKTR